MAIDFSKPATTDNYSSAFVPALVAHQTALAQWLDSSQTTITGTPPTYAKRYNRSTTAVEEFNGLAWAPIGLHGLTYSAGNLGVGYGTPVHALDLGPASGTGRARIRGVMIGNAGGGYPTVGYNASPSGAATWAYDVADTASWVYFHPTGTRFFIAAAGAAGAAIAPIEYLRADTTGNLGMGTGAPTNNGANYRNIDLRGASGGGAFMYAGDGAGTKSRFGYNGAAGGTVLSSLNTDPILFEINAVTGMTLTTTGLGIGTATPSRKLTLAGAGAQGAAGAAAIMFNNTLTGRLAIIDLDNSQNLTIWNSDTGSGATIFMRGAGVGVESMRIDAIGNLGINHASPGAYGKLVVADTNGTLFFTAPTVGYGDLGMVGGPGNVLRIGPSGYASGGVALMYTTAGSARTEGARLDGAGNFGVGKTAPLRRLDVAGAAMTSASPVGFSATPTFDAASTNLIVFGSLTANVTSMAISNPQEGQFLSIRMRQDATGGRTVALPAGAAVSGTINTAANKTSYLNLTYNATDARWDGNWSQIP